MNKITVVKRSGNKEPLAVEKWQAQIAKVCKGIADVSQSMIEIKSQPHFYDGITTEEIDGITLRAVVDLIDVESNPDLGHTNYQYVAGKQRLSMLRKDVYGSYTVPHLYTIVKKNVEVGLYTPELLQWYTEDDWNRMNDMLDHEKDELHKFDTWWQRLLFFIKKNLTQLVCVLLKNIIKRPVMVYLLWLLLCLLVLVLLPNNFLAVCLSAVMMTLTPSLPLVK